MDACPRQAYGEGSAQKAGELPFFDLKSLRARSIDNSPLIPALGSRKAAHGVRVPAGASGLLAIEAKVLFRSFAPATLRAFAVGQYVGLITEPFLMDEVEGTVAVGP